MVSNPKRIREGRTRNNCPKFDTLPSTERVDNGSRLHHRRELKHNQRESASLNTKKREVHKLYRRGAYLSTPVSWLLFLNEFSPWSKKNVEVGDSAPSAQPLAAPYNSALHVYSKVFNQIFGAPIFLKFLDFDRRSQQGPCLTWSR